MRRIALLCSIALLATAVTAMPATAAEEPVGEWVSIMAGESVSLPEGTPFFVIHGWSISPSASQALGAAEFRLDIDGVDQGRGSLLNFAGDGDVFKFFLFNFEEGLPVGTYTLTGHWFFPCRSAVEFGDYSGTCEKPNIPVEVLTLSIDLTITP